MEILKINKHPENIISEYIREKLNDKESTSEFLNKCIYIEQMEIDHRDAEHFSVEGFSVEDMNEEYERIEDDLKDISSKEEMIRTCRSRSYSEPRSISFNIRMREESKNSKIFVPSIYLNIQLILILHQTMNYSKKSVISSP